MSDPAFVEEREILEAIRKADRFVVKDGYTLRPTTSALAEILGTMFFERVERIELTRLTAKQLAALQESRQQELIPEEGSPSCPTP